MLTPPTFRMTIPDQTPEKPLRKTLRIIVGIALAFEGAIFFSVSCFSFVMTLLMGGLAFLASGAAATDQQMKATGLMLLFMLLYPFVWTFTITLSAINILLRKRSALVVILCILSILNVAGVFAYLSYMGELSLQTFTNFGGRYGNLKILAVVMTLIPMAGIIVAIMMRPAAGDVQK